MSMRIQKSKVEWAREDMYNGLVILGNNGGAQKPLGRHDNIKNYSCQIIKAEINYRYFYILFIIASDFHHHLRLLDTKNCISNN